MAIDNDEKLVSIIIPVYNVEQYIGKCLDSVINQTYKNIEIIIIDDGSPDESPKICDEYEQNDSRVKVYHNKNVGISGARNFGVEHSKGEFIIFLDSDDYVSEDCIEHLVDLLKEYGADCAFAQIKVVYDDCGVADNQEENIEILSGKETRNRLLTGEIRSYVNSKIFSRKCLEGNLFPLGRIYEDEGTLYRICDAAEKVVVSNCVLGFYRMQSNSITHLSSNSSKGLVHQFQNYYEQYEWGKEKKLELQEFLFQKAVYCAVVACNQQAKGYTLDGNIHDNMKSILKEYSVYSNKKILNWKKRIQVWVILNSEDLYVALLSVIRKMV